jgi:acetyltransferase
MIDVIALGNGSRVTIRPMLPQDLGLQMQFFRSLSSEGRYNRFMARFQELPRSLVELVANFDYRSHFALLAEIFEDGQEIMIGEARYVIDPNDPASCEIAIAVSDEWHANGIAKALLERLEQEAFASGVTRMMAETLRSNEAMIRLGRRAGYTIKAHADDPKLAQLEKHLQLTRKGSADIWASPKTPKQPAHEPRRKSAYANRLKQWRDLRLQRL